MGTKNNPGKFDCYAAALPDEPLFVLLARDPQFYELVCKWGNRRYLAIQCGDRPPADMAMVQEANDVAIEGAHWRKENNGLWRMQAEPAIGSDRSRGPLGIC